MGSDGRFDARTREVIFCASVAAAGIHFAVTPDHLIEYAPAGVFMAVVGVAQLAWGVWVARGAPPRIVRAGARASAAIIAVWLVSRTIGMPVGPHRWIPEAVGDADVLASILEVFVIVAVSEPRARLVAPVAVAAFCSAVVVPGEAMLVAATLILGATARAVVTEALPRLVVPRPVWRTHETLTAVRFGALHPGDADVAAPAGARG